MKALATDWVDQPVDDSFLTSVASSHASWTEEIEEIKETEETDEAYEVEVVGEEVWRRINHALQQCTLTSSHTSNTRLFDLSRRIRGIEQVFGIRFLPLLLEEVYDGWQSASREFLRPDHDYFTEFLVKLNAVRCPWGAKLSASLARAYKSKPPARVMVMQDADAHVLASLCRDLQEKAGVQPFYIVGRSCAELMGRSHSTIAAWLNAFQTLRIICLTEQGKRWRASRYRYIAPD